MGDAADILGVKKEKKEAGFESALGGEAKARRRTAQPKPPNVSREVFALLKQQGESASAGADGSGSAGPSNFMLPPMMPSSATAGPGGALGFKGASRRGAANSKVKWTWAKYSNSARGGDTQPFYRWNKAGIEFQDYPYARFNVQMAKLEYSDQEYAEVVAPLADSSKWTRAEDDALCHLAQAYSCRWPVIHDRWTTTTALHPGVGDGSSSGGVAAGSLPQRPAIDLQHRYCTMAQALLLARKRKLTADAQQAAAPAPLAGSDQASGAGAGAVPGGASTVAAVGAGAAGAGAPVGGSYPSMLALDASNQSAAMVTAKIEDQARALGVGLGLQYVKSLEAERRALLEAAWQRSRPDDKTEDQLKEELKQVEAELRRVRKVIATKPPRGSKQTAAAAAAAANASRASLPPEPTSSSSVALSQQPESAAAAVAAETATATAQASKAMSFVAQNAAAGSSSGGGGAAPTTAGTAAAATAASSSSSSGGASAGRPYRLSARLAVPTEESGAPKGVALSRDRATKLASMLSELQVPPRLHCPTPVACDLYDALRRDVVVLLSLQKLVERGRQDVVQMQQQLAAPLPSAAPAAAASSSSTLSSSSAAAEGGDGSGASGEGGGGGEGSSGGADGDAKAPAGDKSKRKGGASGGARKRPRK